MSSQICLEQNDVWRFIIKKLDFITIIHLLSSCHYFYDNFYVIDLCNIDYKYLYRLSDEILQQHKFQNVQYLDASNNKKITDVSWMNKLQILDASDDCGIDQNGIDGLNLVELHALDNSKINI